MMIREDAPFPTPDPWAADAPERRRCTWCGLPEPGAERCRRCGKPLVIAVRTRRPRSLNLVNLFVVLLGRGPLTLAIAGLYNGADIPLINPWTIYLAAATPLFWLLAFGLLLRWRWVWYTTVALALADLLAQIGLQLVFQFNPVVPLAAIVSDLIVLGLLLTTYDEVRIENAPIDLPPRHAMPKTPIDAFNAGVALSRQGQWYLAARMWQRAVALKHSEFTYRRALGMAYLRLKELPAAEAELQAAARIQPDDAQTRQLLDVLQQLQRQQV